MNGKKAFKKVISITVFSLVFLCFSIGALAANATHSTTTTYDLTSGMINVASTVDGVTEGEEVTYLAYKGDLDEDGEIFYIDQDTVEEGEISLTFSYSTYDSAIGSLIKFGAMNTTVDNPEPADASNTLADYDLTVTITGNGTVSAFGDSITASNTIKVGNDFDIILTPAYANTIQSAEVTYNSQPAETFGGLTSKAISGNTGNMTLNVVFEEITEPTVVEYEPSSVPAEFNAGLVGKKFAREIDAGNPQNNKTTAFGKVVTATELNVEYGILFSESQANINSVQPDGTGIENTFSSSSYDANKVYKFRAIQGKGTGGLFAVILIDGGSGIIDGAKAYYTRTYVNNNGTYTYGNVTTIEEIDD